MKTALEEKQKAENEKKDLPVKKKSGSKGFKVQSKFDTKKWKEEKRKDIRKLLLGYLEKAGVEEDPRSINRKILRFSVGLISLLSLIVLIAGIVNASRITAVIFMLIGLWTLVFFAAYLISVMFYVFWLDLRIYQRTKQIEEVLPDFLQLAASNISAGMPIDKALWFAVRPSFGVLSKEIEDIAKATIAGEDLDKALIDFSNKYKSKIVKEAVALIVAGIKAGGELAELLNKISINIQETKLMKKEISANVATYAIFIGIATIIAAPILFALSTELLVIVQQITTEVAQEGSGEATGFFSFNFSGEGIELQNFKNFAMIVLTISAFFSAAIISTIRKGGIADGVKLIPVFIVTALTIYSIATLMFSYMMGGII